MTTAEVSELQATIPAFPDAARLMTDGMSALVAALVEEMAARWEHGEQPVVEDYLALYPALADHAAAVVRLIEEEVSLRQKAGQTVDDRAVLARFPQYRAELDIV